MHKFCDVCQTTKATKDFPKSETLRSRCKACGKAYVARRKKKITTANLKKYGLVEVQYMTMLKIQKGLCKICGNSESSKALAVDHDHKTGVVRGLLCQRCNQALGFVRDSISVLESMIKYLGEKNVRVA